MTTPSKLSVTFTGADNRTTADDLIRIADASREHAVPVEFALLCSTSRAGEDRYPTGLVAKHLLRVCRGENVPVAVHLCGAAARAVLSNRCYELDAFGDKTTWRDVLIEVASTGRVQVNLPRDMSTPENLRSVWHNLLRLVDRSGWATMGVVIGQHRDGAWPERGPVAEITETGDLAWLLDRSGGHGIPVRVEDIPSLPDYAVGIAGGLGPDDNTQAIAAHLLRSTHGGWLDMESRIRHGGKLDADLCIEVLRRVALARDEVG